jgi:cellulose synthase/poly-beta-1,6-N-acetylglucosamine synthase-like glycosyltransferase
MKKILSLFKAGLNFWWPKKISGPLSPVAAKYLVAIIPTYKPTQETYNLIAALLSVPVFDNTKQMRVVVVNDCAPNNYWNQRVLKKIHRLSLESNQVDLIKTHQPSLKPGALNHGLSFLRKRNFACDAVITMDDDIRINQKTIPNLINYLFSHKKLGAACTISRVANKNKNLLTRMQGLEYHNFNITKIADNGFFQGPLVMQGMLAAFKSNAINQIKGYSRENLIEDYEITAKLKKMGWLVGICQSAHAYTDVPEKFSTLWKQRVRWSYWGLLVVKNYLMHLPAVIQDVMGHSFFLLLTSLIALSFLTPSPGSDPRVIEALVLLALAQFSLAYIFSIYILNRYRRADWLDYLLRITIIPEMVYLTVLSLVVYGSYLFFIYNQAWGKIIKMIPSTKNTYLGSLKIFSHLGYTLSWGTRKL